MTNIFMKIDEIVAQAQLGCVHMCTNNWGCANLRQENKSNRDTKIKLEQT